MALAGSACLAADAAAGTESEPVKGVSVTRSTDGDKPQPGVIRSCGPYAGTKVAGSMVGNFSWRNVPLRTHDLHGRPLKK